MIRLSSIRRPVLVGIVLTAWFTSGAEAPMCTTIYMPFVHNPTISLPTPVPLIPMVADLAFTADVSASIVLADGSEVNTVEQLSSIARDSEGRVSVKSRGHRTQIGGPMTFNMTICDPVSGTETTFQACEDNASDPASSDKCSAKKAARVSSGPHRSPDSSLPVFPDPSKPLPAHHSSAFVPRSGELVDLGEKDLEGVRVHGYRNVDVREQDLTCIGVPVNTSKEWWLSEKSALEVSVTIRKSANGESEENLTPLPEKCLGGVTIKLTNIRWAEPEPELFKAPPDYRIIPIDNTWKGTVPWKPTVKPQ
jgi:hypothetical protein